MSDKKPPSEHPIIDRPTTVADCKADRAAAKGPGAAAAQLAQARQHAAEQAATR